MGDEAKKIPNIRQKTHKEVDTMMDKAENMRKHGKEKITQVKKKAIMVRENVDGYIRKNPEKSVLIATGVGLAAGAVLAARFRRKSK